ncbi:baseplate J/gp47 family protein [Aureisphaera galaxeae]|uniref:baseplate J/gp47 family protein n=1 Tax=Aureisphaera galaxeae TaxID=1538023 RepID=UPI00235090D9|nr:baseplate J/gp47 family protein [Aureisphaera galaxeae]MDC8005356.1 baseplate J/gp47 family protein [Aureisphaera galaxeae]
MSNCDIDIATHKRTACSQTGRMPKALHTDFVAVDERTIADLIVSTNTLSQHINFYNKDNVLLDNWDTFFQWETTAILAQIASLDIAKYLSDFQLKRRELLFVPDLGDQQDIILPFFEGIGNHAQDLFKKVEHLPKDFDLREYLMGTQARLELLLTTIESELAASTDLLYTLQHHLFNKNIQNFFGLLTQWKDKSETKLYDNLENYPEHSPQYALYLAFLKLFGFAQENLNEYTQRHLDFYYRKILRLSPEGAQPDHVHLYIEPHKNEAPFLLEEGAVFKAGKDSEGNEKYYGATSDVAINQAKVSTLYGASKESSKYYFQDSTELNAAGDSWKPFPQQTLFSDIGFVLAAPILFLRGGSREIHLTFKDASNKIVEVPTDKFDFFLSGEEGWLEPVVGKDRDSVTLSLNPDDKPILPFDAEIHEGVDLETPFPALKIVAKDGTLTRVTFSSVTVKVVVTGYDHFKLFSNTGELDHTKSFEPYGALPRNGMGLIFACKEFFQKKNAKGTLWLKADTDEWWAYLVMLVISRLTFLEDGKWLDGNHWDFTSGYAFTNKSAIPYDFSENEELVPGKTEGFANFFLNWFSFEGNSYLEDYINAAKAEGNTTLPYLPVLASVLFDYEASATFSSSGGRTTSDFSLMHLYPKGYKMLKGSKLSLLPSINNDGELFIGIGDLEGGNSVSLLFQVAEGSANPRQTPIDLKWKYLSGTTWTEFEPEDLGDDTNGLTQSGIVKMNSPEDLKWDEQTELPSGYWWIKIEAAERIDAICDLIGIHAQALKAVLTDFEEAGTQFIENTPEKTISKLYKTRNEIKKIEQPYPSFGGKLEEDDNMFYQRTSERLRHKGKAITMWDYEKLVLDNFPDVFQVKCLNHHRYDTAELSNTSAGYVTIIPVAKGGTIDVPDYWKPIVDLGTMKNIQTFLKERATPHARIAVKPPKLEKLELDFKVKYIEIPGADTRLYAQQLQDVINIFLSPWAYNDEVVADFQEEIEKSRLIQLIEHQSYVDYISDFKVNHLILEETTDDIKQRMNDVERIIPKTAYSLFVPHTHKIETLTVECCS